MTLTQIILRILDWCVQGVKGYIYGLLVEENGQVIYSTRNGATRDNSEF